MGLSRNNQTNITFDAGSASKTMSSANTRYNSDIITFDSSDVQASIGINVDTASTVASGDYVDVWIKFSANGTDFDTDEHATYLGRWNNFSTDNPGEDPAYRTVDIPCSAKAFKLSPQSGANAATRNQTLTAILHTQRAS